ncbi:Uncharacterised protein [Streptococcus pneumoniae]|nr:Uncharacterised protein [Streptococcus pneumoniae]VRY70315.1 Uncharacterised protein [Streptococcus pneumoniae]
MPKKKIERISVIHREKILWLKWYFMRDKEKPKYPKSFIPLSTRCNLQNP